MCFKQDGAISMLNNKLLKVVNYFTYLGSNIISSENNVKIHIGKAWTILPNCGCVSTIVWLHHQDFEKAQGCCVLLWTNPGSSPSQKKQLYGYLPPIWQTIQIRWTRLVGHSWKSRDKLISKVFLWATTQGRPNAGQHTKTYIHQFCADAGCQLENLPRVINNRDGWRERVRGIHASSMTWWFHINVPEWNTKLNSSC